MSTNIINIDNNYDHCSSSPVNTRTKPLYNLHNNNYGVSADANSVKNNSKNQKKGSNPNISGVMGSGKNCCVQNFNMNMSNIDKKNISADEFFGATDNDNNEREVLDENAEGFQKIHIDQIGGQNFDMVQSPHQVLGPNQQISVNNQGVSQHPQHFRHHHGNITNFQQFQQQLPLNNKIHHHHQGYQYENQQQTTQKHQEHI